LSGKIREEEQTKTPCTAQAGPEQRWIRFESAMEIVLQAQRERHRQRESVTSEWTGGNELGKKNTK